MIVRDLIAMLTALPPDTPLQAALSGLKVASVWMSHDTEIGPSFQRTTLDGSCIVAHAGETWSGRGVGFIPAEIVGYDVDGTFEDEESYEQVKSDIDVELRARGWVLLDEPDAPPAGDGDGW